jgi:hypothetical protein
MRRSNFALRLQPSLLEELRKAAELEGVALNPSLGAISRFWKPSKALEALGVFVAGNQSVEDLVMRRASARFTNLSPCFL